MFTALMYITNKRINKKGSMAHTSRKGSKKTYGRTHPSRVSKVNTKGLKVARSLIVLQDVTSHTKLSYTSDEPFEVVV